MDTRLRGYLFGLSMVAPVVVSVGCTESNCFGVVQGRKVTITVVEPYDLKSHFKFVSPFYDPGVGSQCGFGFDFMQGQALDATIVATGGNISCHAGLISIAPFGDWRWTLVSTASDLSGNEETPLQGSYRAQSPTCNGFTNVTLYTSFDPSSTPNALFEPSVPGQVPNVVMERGFQNSDVATTSPTCPAWCVGDFVVNLQPQ